MNVTIRAYKYKELDEHSQFKVVGWLDEWPIDYEDENGKTKWEYFTEMTEQDLAEHCESNNYLFNKLGEPIHHLIIE